METVEKLRNRIGTAEELQSVVKTMKGLSAVSIRSYERAAKAVGTYSEGVKLGLQILLSQNRGLGPGTPHHGPTKSGIIVFGSEQGLCGPFNRHVCEHALSEVGAREITPEGTRIAAVGSRLGDELSIHVSARIERFPMPASVDAVTERVADILVMVTRWLEDGDVGHVILFNNRQSSGSTYKPAGVRLFPYGK